MSAEITEDEGYYELHLLSWPHGMIGPKLQDGKVRILEHPGDRGRPTERVLRDVNDPAEEISAMLVQE